LVPCLPIRSPRIWLRTSAGTEVTPAWLLAERSAVATLRPTGNLVPRQLLGGILVAVWGQTSL